METILELPYPPTVNTYYTVARGRKILSARGRQYKKDVERICMLQRVEKFNDQRLDVSVIVYPPTRRKFDLDNCLKAILDSLKSGGVYADDSQIDRITVTRGPVDKLGPGALVAVSLHEDVVYEVVDNLQELLITALHTSEVAH